MQETEEHLSITGHDWAQAPECLPAAILACSYPKMMMYPLADLQAASAKWKAIIEWKKPKKRRKERKAYLLRTEYVGISISGGRSLARPRLRI